MVRTYLSLWLKERSRLVWRSEKKGQSIIIITFAFLGLIAMLGLALDLGLVYIERIRVSRTADAAALAGVVELPFEEEAMRRAIEYIELNGYRVGVDTEVRIRGCIVPPSGGSPPPANFGEGSPGAGYSGSAVVKVEPTAISPETNAMIAGHTYIPAVQPRRAIFVIDTMAYQAVSRDAGGAVTSTNSNVCTSGLYGTANKLRVSGQVQVDMNFMQFFGFGEVPVSANAVGENVTNLDVVVVFDVSGSMRFETTCFGCWNEDTSKDPIKFPFPLNGNFNPLNYDPPGPTTGHDIFWQGASAGDDVCGQNPAAIEDTAAPIKFKYLVHEAEFYSRDVPLHGWEFSQRQAGQGFWVLQRMNGGSNKAHIRTHVYPTYSQQDLANYPQLQGAAYNGECFSGGSLSGECWKTRADSLGEQAPSSVPWVEYDFTPQWSGQTAVWVRVIGGDDNYASEWKGRSPTTAHTVYAKAIYWQIDGNNVRGGPFDNVSLGNQYTVSDNAWYWLKLGSETTQQNVRSVLKLYQGSSGFNVDKIIFTNNLDGDVGMAVNNVGTTYGDTLVAPFKTLLQTNGGAGPDPTKGSATREACNMCNPAFGKAPALAAECSCRTSPGDTGGSLYPRGGTGVGCTSLVSDTNHLADDLFHDEDPLRSAQEAVKNFAARLDPKFDQIGFVAYSTGINGPRVKLQCLRYAGKNLGSVAKCFEPGSNPISYTNVISAVEAHNPSGRTNIAMGMVEGLEELGINVPGYNTGIVSDCSTDTSIGGDKESCDRQGAARRIIVLMTDGSPNLSTSCGSLQWRGRFAANTASYNCAIYYAQAAADNNVTVYTIGIGSGVNVELLTAMATGTDPNPKPGDNGFYFEGKGGKYYPAAQPDDLDAIFTDILSNIYVRIVG